MARPIEPTPTLSGEAAREFLEKIEEPPSKEAIAFMKEVIETFKESDSQKED